MTIQASEETLKHFNISKEELAIIQEHANLFLRISNYVRVHDKKLTLAKNKPVYCERCKTTTKNHSRHVKTKQHLQNISTDIKSAGA